MPPLSSQLQAAQDYYNFAFLEDGFPARGMSDGLRVEPIYGVYVLNDYLKQHARSPSSLLTTAISTVARSTLRRMDSFKEALVFWYEVDPRYARLHTRHYSGLTQAYYAVSLRKAADLLGDETLKAGAERVFQSLLIPVSEGGVHSAAGLGINIAEVPQEPNSWILNGWQSILVSLHEYSRLADSAPARELFESSLETMAAALPRFDHPELRTTRYGLSGYVYLRLTFGHTETRVTEIKLRVPDEGEFNVGTEGKSRWQNYLFEDDLDDGRLSERRIRLNLVLSRASAPRPNEIALAVTAPEPTTMTVEAQIGRYDPLSSSPIGVGWRELQRVDVPEGTGQVRANLPWNQELDLVGYPTNFLKKLEGQCTNVYHPVHIKRLRELHSITDIPSLREWASVWSDYICEWTEMPLYKGLMVRDYSRGLSVVTADEYCRRNASRGTPEDRLDR